ncbi:MAG: hypothetical protein RBT74_06740 [Tenuifilaceae bacterium]|jgi:hypothetical protein|nr:hypothetical protein [Tenuifilaceae bacterium]
MKTVNIFEDKQKLENLESVINSGVEKVQALVNEFNALGMGELEPHELPKLMRDPLGLYSSRTENIEIPSQFDRDKYLQLLNLPSTQRLTSAWDALKSNDMVRSPDLLMLIADKVLPNRDEVEQLKGYYRVTVTEDSPEHYRAKDYFQFISVLNKIASNRQHVLTNTAGTNVLLDIVSVKRDDDGMLIAVPTLDKLKQYISGK